MGGLRRRRQQERDRRSGHEWTVDATNRAATSGSLHADAYVALATRLAGLRSAVAADRFTSRAPAEVQDDRADLERALGEAIALAFAADANGSALPDGVTSWVSEGLQRSDERELLMLASNGPSTDMRWT